MITAIVILNYNNFQDTINCLESIEHFNTADIRIVVVDNGSSNDSVEMLSKYISSNYSHYQLINSTNLRATPLSLPHITLIGVSKNLGYARGNNIGIDCVKRDSSVENLMILNNDILFTQDIIPELCNYLRMPKTGIVSPLLHDKFGNVDYHCARKSVSYWKLVSIYLFDFIHSIFHIQQPNIIEGKDLLDKEFIEIELPSGSCMLLKITTADEIGLFDPHTFLYFEENIMYEKEKQIGLKNIMVPRLICTHLGAGSTKLSKSEFIQKCNKESAYYFVKDVLNVKCTKLFIFKLALSVFQITEKMFRLIKA